MSSETSHEAMSAAASPASHISVPSTATVVPAPKQFKGQVRYAIPADSAYLGDLLGATSAPHVTCFFRLKDAGSRPTLYAPDQSNILIHADENNIPFSSFAYAVKPVYGNNGEVFNAAYGFQLAISTRMRGKVISQMKQSEETNLMTTYISDLLARGSALYYAVFASGNLRAIRQGFELGMRPITGNCLVGWSTARSSLVDRPLNLKTTSVRNLSPQEAVETTYRLFGKRNFVLEDNELLGLYSSPLTHSFVQAIRDESEAAVHVWNAGARLEFVHKNKDGSLNVPPSDAPFLVVSNVMYDGPEGLQLAMELLGHVFEQARNSGPNGTKGFFWTYVSQMDPLHPLVHAAAEYSELTSVLAMGFGGTEEVEGLMGRKCFVDPRDLGTVTWPNHVDSVTSNPMAKFLRKAMH